MDYSNKKRKKEYISAINFCNVSKIKELLDDESFNQNLYLNFKDHWYMWNYSKKHHCQCLCQVTLGSRHPYTLYQFRSVIPACKRMLTYGKRMHLLVTIQVFNMHAVPCAFDPHKTYICQHSFSLASEPVLTRLVLHSNKCSSV